MREARILAEHEYKQFFEFIQPYRLLAPFGLPWGYEPQSRCYVVTSSGYTQDFEHKNYEVRTYENNHAKLAIGDNGVIFGSWNWSLKHERKAKHRELVVFAKVGCTLFEQLEDFFEETWKTAHPFTEPTGMTKLHEVP